MRWQEEGEDGGVPPAGAMEDEEPAITEVASLPQVEEEVCSIVAECDSDADVDLEEFDWQEWYDAAPLYLGSDGLCRSIDAMFFGAPRPGGPSVC